MRNLNFVAVLFAGAALAGCSSESPVTPAGLSAAVSDLSARPGSSAAGLYQLSFLQNGQPVQSLVIGQRVILKGRVVNASSGAPATDGAIVFQYCSRPGPKGNITRADEAPRAECDAGSAKWVTLVSIGVNENGEAFGGLGPVQIPRTIGFRFLFRSEKSGIAGGGSPELDFTWDPLP
jgi:hypothetical protein